MQKDKEYNQKMKEKVKLYKVLVDRKSCHGGDTEWKLKQWTPEIIDVKMCEKGYHLTTKPENWYKFGCEFYEAEAEEIIEWGEDKCVCKSARIISKVPKPEWIIKVEDFIKSLPKFKFGKQDGKPLKEWRYFEKETLIAARDAAWDAARDAANNAVRDAANAAGYAALYTRFLIISDLIDKNEELKKHWTFVKKCWQVYQKGYWLRCDVNGILYVYGVKA